jgi:hypothetical protein
LIYTKPDRESDPVKEKDMRKWLSGFCGISLAVLLSLVFAFQGAAQEKKAKVKMYNVQGSVSNLDKAKMTMTVKTSNVPRDVVYSADTKFMYGHSKDNKPGSSDAIKDGFFVSCEGTYDGGKPPLKASMCVYRETK